jgi:hypothetical protein
VFAHFLCQSALELRIRSSFLHFYPCFFQIMERLRISWLSLPKNARKSGFCSNFGPICPGIAHMRQFFTDLAGIFPDYGASGSFSWLTLSKNAHKCGFCSNFGLVCPGIAHTLQFFTVLARIYPGYGASAHFRGYPS